MTDRDRLARAITQAVGAIHAERLYAILDAVETAGWAPVGPPAAPADSHVDGSHGPVRRAVRAIMQKKIDELTAERDQARQFAATDRRALLDTLALVKADRDRLAADIGVHRRTIDGCHERIAELERVRDLHAERAARLSDDLATARRGAAADALDWASRQPDRCWTTLRDAAIEVRAGTRTIPPADRSSDE